MLVLALSEGGGFNPLDPSAWPNGLWTILIFVAALPFMWKMVFGPIVRALDERETRSREAAHAAEAARDEAVRLQEAMNAEMEEARREASQRIDEARKQAETRERDIMARAEEQAAQARQKAQGEIDLALARAKEELRSDAVRLGVEIAQKVLNREFDDADQDRLVGEFERDLQGGSS